MQNLLRQSRLAGLHPAPQGFVGNNAPRLQVVATTPAHLHRRNWGLKGPIPAKHRSLYLTISALDSEVGLAQYEPGSGFYRKLQRFREFGVPVQQSSSSESPLFRPTLKPAKRLDTMTQRQLDRIISQAPAKRQRFTAFYQDFFQANPASRRDSEARKQLLDHFYNHSATYRRSFDTKFDRYTVSGAVGINYTAKGVIHNTPEGIYSRRAVKGREVGKSSAALGGFVTETKAADFSDNRSSRSGRWLRVQTVEVEPNGALSIEAIPK